MLFLQQLQTRHESELQRAPLLRTHELAPDTWGVSLFSKTTDLQSVEPRAKLGHSTIFCRCVVKVANHTCNVEATGQYQSIGSMGCSSIGRNPSFQLGKTGSIPVHPTIQNLKTIWVVGLTARHLPFKQFDDGAEPSQPTMFLWSSRLGTRLLSGLTGVQISPGRPYPHSVMDSIFPYEGKGLDSTSSVGAISVARLIAGHLPLKKFGIRATRMQPIRSVGEKVSRFSYKEDLLGQYQHGAFILRDSSSRWQQLPVKEKVGGSWPSLAVFIPLSPNG